MRATHAPVLALLLGPLAGCESPPAAATDAGDVTASRDVVAADLPSAADVADAPVACPPLPTLAPGDPTGATEPLSAGVGAVRAGRLSEARLPRSANGLGEWRAGDYVLANERLALIVEGARPSSGYMPWGGYPLGVGRLAGGAVVEPADFGELAFTLGRFAIAPERVGVLRDGSDGTAVVRAVGPMRAIPFIDEFARAIAPTDYGAIRGAIDYELRPGSDHVDVFVTFEVSETQGYMVRTALHAFFQGYRMPRFVPGAGFGEDTVRSRTLGWISDGLTSWAWQLPRAEDALASFISTSGFDSFSAPPVTLPACAQTRIHWARLVAGGPGLDGLTEALARDEGSRLRAVTGTVTSAAQAPPVANNARPRDLDGRRATSPARAPTRRGASRCVPRGRRARDGVARRISGGRGRRPRRDRDRGADAPRDVSTPGHDTEGGAPVPVRVQVFAADGNTVPAAPGAWGETALGHPGRVLTEFPTDGRLDAPIPPGRWRVVVSRGSPTARSSTRP
ncbi:MAG: hypothetical protein U0325_01375 [Polyangiales bacterium]